MKKYRHIKVMCLYQYFDQSSFKNMMKKDINSKATGQITFPEFHLFEYLCYLLASVEIIGFKVL